MFDSTIFEESSKTYEDEEDEDEDEEDENLNIGDDINQLQQQPQAQQPVPAGQGYKKNIIPHVYMTNEQPITPFILQLIETMSKEENDINH